MGTNPTTITATPGEPFIAVEREFEAAPAKLFRAYTDPELVARWLGPRERAMTVDTYDARTGGTYRYLHTAPGQRDEGFRGVFHSVAPDRIVQTFEWEGAPGEVCLESVTFEDLGGRTRVVTRSVFPSVAARDAAVASGMEHGINDSKDRLAELVTDCGLVMGKIIVAAAMSVDGYVADPTDAVGPLFDWYSNGDVAIAANPRDREFHLTRASADHLRPAWANTAATMIGRRLFDLTDGWSGIPAVGERVFVVTHRPAPPEWLARFPDAPFTFVTDGVASAVARAKEFAGDRDVVVTAGDVGGQVVEAGLADQVDIAQVPVVFGVGVRFFGGFAQGPLLLENPTVVEGDRVTHLRYRVRRP